MKLQVTVRWTLGQNNPDNEIAELTGESEPKHEYSDMVLDTNDIRAFNYVDDLHTVLRMADGDNFCIRVPFTDFKKVYVELTGENIMMIQMQEKSSSKKPPKKKNDDDIFLD